MGVTVDSAFAGDASNGGFIAEVQNAGTVQFTDCVFYGKLLGSRSKQSGGFVGWNSGKTIYRGCMFDPEQITMDIYDSYTFTRYSSSKPELKADTRNCYYTMAFGTADGGEKVYKETEDNKLSKKACTFRNRTYYYRADCAVSTCKSSMF